MKKLIAMIVALALTLCGLGALAEGDSAYYPEIEAFVGTWAVDDMILEIVHMTDDDALLNCIVTQYTEDHAGVRWIYDSCAYDDVGNALTSREIGAKFDFTEDEFGELVDSEPVYYEDGAAAFTLNEDGTLTWTDFKETPGENETVFERVEREVADGPEAAFEGVWGSGRATLIIESLDDVLYCTVFWGSSAWEVARWEYADCVYDVQNDCLVSGPDGVLTNLTYGEDGEIASEEQIYDNGEAVFRIDDDGYLLWEDKVENAAEGMRFERTVEVVEAIPVEELATGYLPVILGIEQGTAGASLKLAQAACEVTGFAAAHDLSEAEDENLTACMMVAAEALDGEELSRFAENFDAVRGLLDGCFEDWEANRPAFEDAGAAEDMERLISDEAVRLNWEKLRDGTQAMVDILVD